jgi:hypothetical protein
MVTERGRLACILMTVICTGHLQTWASLVLHHPTRGRRCRLMGKSLRSMSGPRHPTASGLPRASSTTTTIFLATNTLSPPTVSRPTHHLTTWQLARYLGLLVSFYRFLGLLQLPVFLPAPFLHRTCGRALRVRNLRAQALPLIHA